MEGSRVGIPTEKRSLMRFDSDSIDLSTVDTSSGGGGMGIGLPGGLAMGGGGMGIVGLLIWALVSGAFGSGMPAATTGAGAAQPVDMSHCTSRKAQETQTECRLIKVYTIADRVWKEEFSRRGANYTTPRLRLFPSQSVSTACGNASIQVGPFYCPGDSTIYFSVSFLERLQEQIGAQGDFAQAYIMAHEFGHHLQNILGTERKVRRAQTALSSQGQKNQYSVGMELQADCYAGVWATLADRSQDGISLDEGDLAEGLQAAEAVGDDKLQKEATGQVQPDNFTHGTSEQRRQWLEKGMQTADPTQCTTFETLGLPL